MLLLMTVRGYFEENVERLRRDSPLRYSRYSRFSRYSRYMRRHDCGVTPRDASLLNVLC